MNLSWRQRRAGSRSRSTASSATAEPWQWLTRGSGMSSEQACPHPLGFPAQFFLHLWLLQRDPQVAARHELHCDQQQLALQQASRQMHASCRGHCQQHPCWHPRGDQRERPPGGCRHRLRNTQLQRLRQQHQLRPTHLNCYPEERHDALMGATAQQAHLLPDSARVHPRLQLKHLKRG